MVKEIDCLDGNKQPQKIIVDDEDYDLVRFFRWWFPHRQGQKGSSVMCAISIGQLLSIKELVGQFKTEPTSEVDHINGNPLDNRRCNLRIVPRSENQHAKWERIAATKLATGIRCSRLPCPNLASSLVRLMPKKRYLYLCNRHREIWDSHRMNRP